MVIKRVPKKPEEVPKLAFTLGPNVPLKKWSRLHMVSRQMSSDYIEDTNADNYRQVTAPSAPREAPPQFFTLVPL